MTLTTSEKDLLSFLTGQANNTACPFLFAQQKKSLHRSEQTLILKGI